MKQSQTIGLIAALTLIGICYMPWITIASKELIITGMNAKGTDFGTPGRVNLFFSTIMAVFFALPKVWAKRLNVFIGALNFSWAIRNYIVLTTCMMGECPEKKPALIVLVTLSATTLLMTFLTKIEVSQEA